MCALLSLGSEKKAPALLGPPTIEASKAEDGAVENQVWPEEGPGRVGSRSVEASLTLKTQRDEEKFWVVSRQTTRSTG